MKTAPLQGASAAGRVALVDDEDCDLVSQFRWFVTELERVGRNRGPYARANAVLNGKPRHLKMHILITGWAMVDHIDHDGLNNQRHNLRPTTPRANQQNRRSNAGSTSKFKGVCWYRARSKWIVQINVNGRNSYVGQADDEKEAARMYDYAAWAAFGPLACLNFPDEHPALSLGATPVMFPNRDGWMPSIKPLRPTCTKCGGPLRIVSTTGICTRNLECARANKGVRENRRLQSA